MILGWKISRWKEAQNGSPWPDWKSSICFFNRTFITWWRRRPPRGARSTHSSISTPSTRHVATRQSLHTRQVAHPRSTPGLLYDERAPSCRSTSQSFSAIHHISNSQFWKLSYLSIHLSTYLAFPSHSALCLKLCWIFVPVYW